MRNPYFSFCFSVGWRCVVLPSRLTIGYRPRRSVSPACMYLRERDGEETESETASDHLHGLRLLPPIDPPEQDSVKSFGLSTDCLQPCYLDQIRSLGSPEQVALTLRSDQFHPQVHHSETLTQCTMYV